MAKQLLRERFQQLAGIKPLYNLKEQQNQALQVTAPDGTVAMITDPRDIGDFISGKGIVYGEDQDGGVIELHIDSALDYQYVANGDENQGALSPQSNEWLEDQVNMYFGGANEPGGEAEFEITRIEQGDPQKYDDAHLAQKFLEELRGLGSIVVRYDDYIGDIKVTSDRDGDAIVTWTWPEGMNENPLLIFLQKNKGEVEKAVGNRLTDFFIDDLDDIGATDLDGFTGYAFRHVKDVDPEFLGAEGDPSRPITIAGAWMNYIEYNI